MSFKRFAFSYLNFTTREKTGIAGLLVLIALLYFIPDLVYRDKDYSAQLKAYEKEIAALDSVDAMEPDKIETESGFEKTRSFEPFIFDPNTVDPQEFEKFGFPQKVIDRFAKFRNAGARFYKKEDLKKLYGLKPELYERMTPYIVIAVQKNKGELVPETRSGFKKLEPEIVNVELNSSDSLSLLKVKGIGPYLSSKIIKYRNALGGYFKIEQLYEIFNIKPDQVDAIKPFLSINTGLIKRLNVNTADYFQLNGHPYISSKEANAIINYRKQHGVYKSRADLEKVILLKKEMIDRLEPYLEF